MAKQVNVGHKLEAVLELTTALGAMQEAGIDMVQALSVPALSVQAHGLEGSILGDAAEEIAQLVFRTYGHRPELAGAQGDAVVAKMLKILALMNWPEGAASYAMDYARDAISDGCFGEIFGDDESAARDAAPVGVPS